MESLYNVVEDALHKCTLLNPGDLSFLSKTTAYYTLPLYRGALVVDFKDRVIAQLESFIEKAQKVLSYYL